ncbi:hypothetical protein [uncultured Cohaesibacter sp.]|nr:hypothetical protein [uncultured Cohaesibacter sp.]
MKLDTDDQTQQGADGEEDRFDFGLWPSFAGLIACLLIIWFMFQFANGSY